MVEFEAKVEDEYDNAQPCRVCGLAVVVGVSTSLDSVNSFTR